MEEVLPPSVMGYTYLDLSAADAWFKVGEMEKGKTGLENSFNYVVDQMEYFFSLPDRFFNSVGDTMYQSLLELREQSRIANENGVDELAKNIEEKFNSYYSTYLSRTGQVQ